MCTWDPDIETSVDVCDFKQTIESARHEKSQKTKMEIYAKAWKLYTGEFLPDMMGEDWAAVENIACRDMYFDCVEELCHYLKTEEKFEELYRVAHSAAEIYPLKNNEREDFNSELDLLKIIENCQNSTKNVAESG